MTSGLLMRPCPPTKKNDEHALDDLQQAYQVNCLEGPINWAQFYEIDYVKFAFIFHVPPAQS